MLVNPLPELYELPLLKFWASSSGSCNTVPQEYMEHPRESSSYDCARTQKRLVSLKLPLNHLLNPISSRKQSTWDLTPMNVFLTYPLHVIYTFSQCGTSVTMSPNYWKRCLNLHALLHRQAVKLCDRNYSFFFLSVEITHYVSFTSQLHFFQRLGSLKNEVNLCTVEIKAFR